MLTNKFDYYDDDILLEGYLAQNEDSPHVKVKPAILVFHDWSGKNEFVCHKARQLAEMGYIGFAVDMYGNGKIAETKDEKSALMQPLMQDRAKLQKRALAAVTTLQKIPGVDITRIAAIGFCFGGLCALDLARMGANIKAVVSFHGLFLSPDNLNESTAIKTKILALHGYDDPMVKHEDLLAFGDEMTKAKADWTVNVYGNTKHAFTNPEANDPNFGTVYNKITAERAWVAMKVFLSEVL